LSERERRENPRRRASLDVRYRVVGAEAQEPTRDISAGGLFVACESPLPLGAEVEVFLEHDDGTPLVVAAEVVRVVWGGRREGAPVTPGMALRFAELSDDARARLDEIVQRS
jgi:uncharacterized protein (TIGR02266 family)